MHVCLQPAAKAHVDVRCRTAFPEDQSGGGDDEGKEEGEEGGGGTCRKRGCSGARARTRTERCGQRETAYSGGEPDMGWRYRGEVGALVGRGGGGKEGTQMG